RVLLLQRRQEPWETPRQHRLAGSGRAAEKQVVPARRRDLERTARAFLAADVREVERRPLRTAVAEHELRRLEVATQVAGGVGEVAYADRLDPCERGLRAGLVRAGQGRKRGGVGGCGC